MKKEIPKKLTPFEKTKRNNRWKNKCLQLIAKKGNKIAILEKIRKTNIDTFELYFWLQENDKDSFAFIDSFFQAVNKKIKLQITKTKIDELLEKIIADQQKNNKRTFTSDFDRIILRKQNYYSIEQMRQAYNHVLEERETYADVGSPWLLYNSLVGLKDGKVNRCLLYETTDREIFYTFLKG